MIIIMFKKKKNYVDMENCESFRGFSFVYVYRFSWKKYATTLLENVLYSRMWM